MSDTSNLASSTTSQSAEKGFTILVASDIHLGYGEKNQILTDDSFNTFEEILKLANSRNVDLILLGGDLFHDPTPSLNSLNRCIRLLRTYVLGDKEIGFEFLSKQDENFPDSIGKAVNYEDENINVSIPVFSIHGDHDDINGVGRLSSMDLLSSCGLINYFGKWTDLSKVEISAIHLKKENTQIALYGLSHIHDQRLARLFREDKVEIHKPDIDDKEIFNLMVLHQNHANRGRYNYVPEEKLPGFLDLIIWGHEHECKIEPKQNKKTKFFISQPGSSVATSLSVGESIEKKVGILVVTGKTFEMTPITLKTVRPFIFRSVNIDEFVEAKRLNEGDTREKVETFYCDNVDNMIFESRQRLTGNSKQPTLPLIHLHIIYTNDSHIINTARFGQKYEKRIANPESLLTFEKKHIKGSKKDAVNPDEAALQSAFDKKQKQDTVEDVVETYFNELDEDNDKLELFGLKSISEVCRLLVQKDDDQAVTTIFQKHYEKALTLLEDKMCSEDKILENIKDFQLTKSKEAYDEAVIENSRVGRRAVPNQSDDEVENEEPQAKGTGAAHGRGAACGISAGSSRGRGKTAPAKAPLDDSVLVVKKRRDPANKQLTIAETTQRSQRYTATKRNAPQYISDSDDD